MKAIIPIAGEGTRNRPHTFYMPKPLMPVAGKAIIAHIVEELINYGVVEITFIVHYMAEDISRFLEQHYPQLKCNFAWQQQPLGLGHAVLQARPYHENDPEVFIVYGDTIFRGDLTRMTSLPDSQIGVMEVEDPSRFGIVIVQEKENLIVELEEKPAVARSRLAIPGVNLIREPRLLFDYIEEVIKKGIKKKNEFQLTDAFNMLVQEKKMRMHPFLLDGWYDAGTNEALIVTNRQLLELLTQEGRLTPPSLPGSIVHPPVALDPTAQIENSIIGPFVTICEKAKIRNALVANSIVFPDAEIENACLQQSLIGKGSHVKTQPFALNLGLGQKVDFTLAFSFEKK